MVHRGPDGKGLWIASDKNTGFGHRRLSIVELSEAASQPMISNDKNIIVTFMVRYTTTGILEKKLQKIQR